MSSEHDASTDSLDVERQRSRRQRTAAVLLAAAGLLLGCSAPLPPNVVLISLDTLRADRVGVYGHEGATSPNIDALARRGTTFLRAYAQAPNTAPSHASIFTSLYPSVHGVSQHGHVLDPAIPTLAGELRAAGYATAAFTQLVGETYEFGFERRHFLPSPRPENLGIGDISMVFRWLEEVRRQPFFLFLHTYEVHQPFAPREDLLERHFPDYRGPLPRVVGSEELVALNSGELAWSHEDLRYLLALYDAELASADAVLGELLQRLRDLGLEGRTIIALLSDHGEEFGEHGQVGRHSHSLYNELLHVPLILVGHGVPSGRTVETAVRSIDVAPTLLRLAGIDPPETFLGRDLRPVWEGREETPRLVLAERIMRSRAERALIAGRYKFSTDGRLFDLAEDPGEQRDVAALIPETAAQLARRLTALESENERLGAAVGQASEVRLTPEEVSRLRALGYLQ